MKCVKCGLFLKSVAHRMSHRRHHFQARPFQCHKDRCLKTFATMAQLQAHRRTHVDRRIYTCRYCHNWFLSRSHRECHRCRFGQPPKHRCPECTAEFHQLLSLSHHIRKSHQAARIKSKSQNQHDLRVGKVLLKISAGKSLTILSDHESSKRTKVKLKRKRKKSFKPKNSGSIILSIKKGMVSIPQELTPSKFEKSKGTTEYDCVPAPSFKVQSQSGELKLRIKTNIPENSVKDTDYMNTNNFSSGQITGKTDSDENSDSPSKIRNGIIIVKDKKGKLCAEQLAPSPYKRKHGENVFDSLKDVGIWKVMQSPRPDGGSEVLKLKLSPQKPIRVIDSSLEDVQAHCTKYLGIATKSNIEQPSDGGLLDLLPTYSKELDSVSNVNDSGIETEVLSSSSCNRSNGNSVRSVALEDNSPTYFNTDGDSLLSPDSPYMENFNKAEHNICSRCGGNVLETNNNTRSPRKCKCSFSNPNSPFQTPVSPVKVSDMNKVQDITAAPVMSDNPNSSVSLNCDIKENEKSGASYDTATELVDNSVNETNDDNDSDIIVMDINGKNRNRVNSEFKGRLRLKLRSDKSSKGKQNQSVADTKTSPKSNSTGVEHKNQKSSRRKVELGSQNSPIVLDDVKIDKECKGDRTSEIENVGPINKLSRKRPLFKRKSQNIEPEDSSVEKKEMPMEHISQVIINDKEVINGDSKSKKPLFKKKQSVENCKEQPINKKPLFKKQISVDALKEKSAEIVLKCVDVDDSEKDKSINSGNKCHDKPEDQKELIQLKTVDVEHDEDSLQHWDENIINLMCEKESKKTKAIVQLKDTQKSDVSNTSLNPFQQQFLSFLSSNITEIKKERLNPGTQKKCTSIENKQEKCLADNNETEITEELRSKDKINEEIAKADTHDLSSNAVLKVHDQKETKVEGTPDSFSWLNIFSGSKQDDAACKRNANEGAHDVMASLSLDLAAINEKMDVSNDDDDNLLDMDDVFKSDKLSTLQPKEFVIEPQVPRKENVSSHLRKRQTAKRTIGKFKPGRQIKKKVELDFTYSESSSDEEMLRNKSEKSDPDFCLHDSEDEFETLPPRKKRTLSTRTCSKSKKYDISSDSDHNESSGNDQSDNDSISSRNQRTKGNKLSCCSCCKNDCDHMSDHDKNSYKLPRDYRQFIKCTVRLLDVQKKLHRLFLALFPDCAEMISSCKVGTAEFDSLMDEVLGGLDDYDSDPEYHRMASDSRPKYLQDETCRINNIGMSFTSPNSVTRTSEIDSVASDDKLCRTPVSSESSPFYLCSEKSYVPYMTAPSSTSLKFENNTLASNDDSVGIPSPSKDSQSCTVSHSCSVTFNSGQVATSQLLLQVATSASQNLSHESYNYKDSSRVLVEPINNFLVTTPDQNTNHQVSDIPFVNPASSGSQILCGENCAELTSIPIVNITIDLNAAHVALCSNPRHCLQTLHDKTIKLIKMLLPSIDFKSNFFKNLDNLEFLIDLLIDSNKGREVNIEADLKCESLVQSFAHAFDSNVEKSVLIPADDSVLVIPIISNDLFKQQIKSQRESLKRDLDVIEEEGQNDDNSWKSSNDIWHSLVSLNNMARSSQSPKRRSRDSRLRKRSADEKRTLFVQEKLNNNQNSTFVCHMHDNVNKSIEQTKKNPRGQRGRRNSKERFFSELDLGNPSASAITTPVSAVPDEKGSFENSFAAFLNRDNFGCGNTDSRQREDMSSKSTVEKNIFELIQSV
ncbi:uncharacterized protein LOC127860824 [Dreissena polymorpha]|uniref:C2H2-type domain-containing protein n=1 Tax=Dreissena polymorpha TaxID=45954 RepID=A0A9D3YHB0_DREPO|nr:uncharacterized protein LOC127860824 [Dreissena polymorpha]KAH3698930.1 hypothetical protein DPMN_073875 [Dreissena polymorpha]